MNNKNITLNQLRKQQYGFNFQLLPYLNNWKKNPYTWLKARFYMETSTVLVYFLLKTNIKPNTVTIVYGLLGITGGILLAIPRSEAILAAISIFFLKGILDWADGYLARIKNQASVTGAILDPYGSLLGALGFQMGLGFYAAQKSEMVIFYYLTALIPLFYAARATSFSRNLIFNECLNSEKIREFRTKGIEELVKNDNKGKDNIFSNRYGSVYNFFKNFLDDRARTVDFICLLILVEIVTPIFITWIVFLGFVIKQFLISVATFYIVAKGGWIENRLMDKLKEISKGFKDE